MTHTVRNAAAHKAWGSPPATTTHFFCPPECQSAMSRPVHSVKYTQISLSE